MLPRRDLEWRPQGRAALKVLSVCAVGRRDADLSVTSKSSALIRLRQQHFIPVKDFWGGQFRGWRSWLWPPPHPPDDGDRHGHEDSCQRHERRHGYVAWSAGISIKAAALTRITRVGRSSPGRAAAQVRAAERTVGRVLGMWGMLL